MLYSQIYLIYIYILLFELSVVTLIAVTLFVAFIVTARKLDKKNTSLSGR